LVRRLAAAFLFVLALAPSASAQLQKWRTHDGKLYFGDQPPPGSTLVGGTGSLPTSGGGETSPVAATTPTIRSEPPTPKPTQTPKESELDRTLKEMMR